MFNLWKRIRIRLFPLIANHQGLLIATLSAGTSAFIGLWIQANQMWPWFWALIVTQLALIFVGVTPRRFAATRDLENLLPSIHQVLGLGEKDRVTIHHIRSRRNQEYEQLTDYYPSKTGRGRIYGFAHGIAGQCFKTRSPRNYTIAPPQTFEQATGERWNFSEDELRRLAQDRRSFFAYPIAAEGVFAKAVVYLDSPDPETFSDAKFAGVRNQIHDVFQPLLESLIDKV